MSIESIKHAFYEYNYAKMHFNSEIHQFFEPYYNKLESIQSIDELKTLENEVETALNSIDVRLTDNPQYETFQQQCDRKHNEIEIPF